MASLSDYHYDLPPELIASRPAAQRDASRLMLVERATGRISDHSFRDLPDILRPRDLLVFNDTRVVRARVMAHKPSGGRVELLFHGGSREHPDADVAWSCHCLTRSSKPLRAGLRLTPALWRPCANGSSGDPPALTVLEVSSRGEALVGARGAVALFDFLERAGEVPLPPYIRRGPDGPDEQDAVRYQTVFARRSGAVAAPTAGLHFTPQVLGRLRETGVAETSLTLHVGPGTFLPVREEDYTRHVMPPEQYEIDSACADSVARHRPPAGRVVAVGTTTVRALEWAARKNGLVRPEVGATGLFVTPGFRFRVIEALLTNFHLPESTLLLLVAAFAGDDLVREAYRHAVAERYRFYSYGDAMLIV